MDLSWGFSVLCLLCLCARLFICALWSPSGRGLTSLLSSVVSNCEFVNFPLIVSIPDFYTLTYFVAKQKISQNLLNFGLKVFCSF